MSSPPEIPLPEDGQSDNAGRGRSLLWMIVSINGGIIALFAVFFIIAFAFGSAGGDAPEPVGQAAADSTQLSSEPTSLASERSAMGQMHPVEYPVQEIVRDPGFDRAMAQASTKEMTAAELFQAVSPSVVLILAGNDDLESQGSGFLVGDGSTVVTNHHVIQGQTQAVVKFSDDTTSPVLGVLGVNREADIAVLQIPSQEGRLPLRLASETPPPGTVVYAIGSPHGLENSLSNGLVSGIREMQDGTLAIQTNAAISPGSSGGPLLTADGTVVGAVTAMMRDSQNLNIAMSASYAKAILERPRVLRSLTEVAASEPPDRRGRLVQNGLVRQRQNGDVSHRYGGRS